MGIILNSSESRASSASSWGTPVQQKDDDLYKPIKNFQGEIIGWIERTASEKLRRKLEKEPPTKQSPRESLESIESDDDAFAKTGTTPPKDIFSETDDDSDNLVDKDFNDLDYLSQNLQPSPVPFNKRLSKPEDNFKPSIKENDLDFNINDMTKRLYEAIQEKNKDELIDILVMNSCEQRQALSLQYKSEYRKLLESEISANFSANFKHLALILIQDPAERDASYIKTILQNDFRIEDIVGTLAWCSKNHLKDIKRIYKAKYGSDLELDLENSAGRRHLPVIRVLLADNRDEKELDEKSHWVEVRKNVDWIQQSIKEDDKHNFKLRLNDILSNRSWSLLPDIFDVFENQDGKDLSVYVKKMLGTKISETFTSLFFVLDEPSAFYAEEIYAAVEGIGTKDAKLQQIFAQRSECDLQSIDNVYKKMFDKRLEKIIKEETSGKYKDLLLAILKP